MVDGVDISFDESVSILYIGDDGTFIDTTSNLISSNSARTKATGLRPVNTVDGDQSLQQGYRVITLPDGVVVGDVMSPFLLDAPERSLMSFDGAVLAVIGSDSTRVYDIEITTNYSALTE